MRILRLGLVLGLLAAGSACGDDEAAPATTATEPTTVVTTTEPSPTTEPSTPPTSPTTPPTEPTTPATEPPPTDPTTTSTTVAPATTDPATTDPVTTDPVTTDPVAIDVRVYLLRGERLAIAHRTVEGPAVLRAALTELLAGPTAADEADELFTTIPDGTELLDVSLAGGVATVDLSREYESGGGSMMMQARIAQVVFTATQFDNVDEVLFWLDGAPIDFLGGEGIVLDEPQARMDVPLDFTGGVLFDSPRPGATVTSPITVTGEGDVFEGDFPLEIRRDGVTIAGPINVFAGAWGDWRDFEATVTVDAAPGPIEIVALRGSGCTPDAEPNCQEFETVLRVELAG